MKLKAIVGMMIPIILFFGFFDISLTFPTTEPDGIKLHLSDDSYVGKEALWNYVWVNTTDLNFGNGSSLVVSTTTVDGRDRRAFLKFSLSSLPSPENIVSAKLFLFKTGNYPPAWGGVGNVEAREVSDDSWIEENITWNNQPAYGGLLDTTYIVFRSSQWYSWDVTSYILDELAGDKVASVCLKAENEDGGYTYRWSSFRSKEYDGFDPTSWWHINSRGCQSNFQASMTTCLRRMRRSGWQHL